MHDGIGSMSWLAVAMLVVCAWLALKVVGFALKLGLWLLVAVAVYWLLAPMLGLPWLA